MNGVGARGARLGLLVTFVVCLAAGCANGDVSRASSPLDDEAAPQPRSIATTADGEAPPPSIHYPGQPTRPTSPRSSTVATNAPAPSAAATSTSTAVPTTVSPVPEFRFDGDVAFATLSAALTDAGHRDALDAAYRLDAELADTQAAEVHGWGDSRGSLAANRQLAGRRVAAVIEAVVTAAPRLAGRLRPVVHGELDPPDPGCRGDCATNRVVLITVITP